MGLFFYVILIMFITRNIIYIVFIAFCMSKPLLVSPHNQDTLNYLYIPFEWTQTPATQNYQIQISNNSDFEDIIFDEYNPYLLEVIENIFEWDSEYHWRCRSIFNDGTSSEWSDISMFNTNSLPDVLFNVNTIIYEPDLVYDGITILDQLWSGHIFAIDLEGKPVWYINSKTLFDNGLEYGLGFTQLLNNGNILGYADGRSNNVPGRAYEMTIANELVWQGPPNLEGIGVHHDVIRLPNGNTMALASKDTLLPLPDADWPFQVDSMIWRGDRIVEWDSQGNQVWSWNCFDHFSLDDWNYSQILHTIEFGSGFYDWTHSNAIWFDPIDNSILLSVRYLSRITKIDYSTGNIIWNMGRQIESGDVEIGNDLGFSYQHAVKVLDNRNIMIYDNGNEDLPITSRGLEIFVDESEAGIQAETVWEYELPNDLSSPMMSDCDRLPNGNSLLTSTASKYLLEVTSDSEKVWEVIPGQNFSTYRGERVAGLFPQIFSVLEPDFIILDSTKTIQYEGQEMRLRYIINNGGSVNQRYIYTIEDLNGWFYYQGNVDVESVSQDSLFFDALFNDVFDNNIITFTIYPEGFEELKKTYSSSIDQELSNNTISFLEDFTIISAYPNPFNSNINITLDVGNNKILSLGIIDISGREIENLLSNKKINQNYKYNWDAGLQSTGIYFVRLELEDNLILTKKIILLR